MAGQFTHILVAKHALDKIALTMDAPFFEHRAFVLAGSVAPDLPYFVKGYGESFEWAERMHHFNTKTAILSGLDYLRNNYSEKSHAWYMGYIAHIMTDLVTHPVVNSLSGPYYKKKKQEEAQHGHRFTEMVQDSYAIKEFSGDYSINDFADTVKKAGHKGSESLIDPDIKSIWNHMFSKVDEAYYSIEKPSIDRWFQVYIEFMSNPEDISGLGSKELFHILGTKAMYYRDFKQVSGEVMIKYIDNVPYPRKCNALQKPLKSRRLIYKEVFEKAVSVVVDTWQDILSDEEGFRKDVRNFSLDTGALIGESHHAKPIYW